MRTTLFASLTLLVISVVYIGPRSVCAQSPTATTEAGTATIIISVKGMSCMACVAKTKQALRVTPGVANVEVKLSPGSATVKYDPSKVTPDKLVAVIKQLGYDATPPAAKNDK